MIAMLASDCYAEKLNACRIEQHQYCNADYYTHIMKKYIMIVMLSWSVIAVQCYAMI